MLDYNEIISGIVSAVAVSGLVAGFRRIKQKLQSNETSENTFRDNAVKITRYCLACVVVLCACAFTLGTMVDSPSFFPVLFLSCLACVCFFFILLTLSAFMHSAEALEKIQANHETHAPRDDM